ncbi:MAG: type II toxin-antitoxin system RelE/ParE family toxin [Nanoarchaeota archaeon]
MTTTIKWDPKAREFLRKLPKDISKRIIKKVDKDVKANVQRYLDTLAGKDYFKIRIGDYRLFADYYQKEDLLIIRTGRHRKEAYKKHIFSD